MATKAPTPPPMNLREIHPEYARLTDKMRELHERSEVLLKLIAPLAEQDRRHSISWVDEAPKPKHQAVTRHAGAVELLGDLLPEQTPAEIAPPVVRPSWPGKPELLALGAEHESIQEAIKLLQPLLAKARAEGSKKIAESRQDEYRQILSRMVAAAKAFGDVLLEHHAFVDGFRLQGAAWSYLRPVNLATFGDLNDPSSPLKQLISDAAEAGHVGADQIPDWKMPTELARLETR
jgi:hypothetical protein